MKSILFDCERMKYPNTGPFNFCLRLGQELLHSSHINDEKLTFLTPEKSEDFFGHGANYFKLGAANKLYLPWSKSRFIRGTSQFDLWHSTYQSTMYYPLNKRTKIILTIHDLNFLYESPDHKKNQKHLRLIQDRINRADHVVSVSKFSLSDIKKHLRLEKPSSVIYNGGNFINSTIIKEPRYIPTRPFLFSIGTVLPKKNFHVLPSLLQHNDFELIISGIDSFPYKKIIIEAAQKFNVADRVRFTGPVSEGEKTWYYKNCSAFLFPSIAEGFGLPVIEAMNHSKPVFLSTQTALPEIGGEYAYYFEDFAPEAMQNRFAAGLTHFQQNHPEEKIKNWAEQFNWSNTAKSYLLLYRKILDKD